MFYKNNWKFQRKGRGLTVGTGFRRFRRRRGSVLKTKRDHLPRPLTVLNGCYLPVAHNTARQIASKRRFESLMWRVGGKTKKDPFTYTILLFYFCETRPDIVDKLFIRPACCFTRSPPSPPSDASLKGQPLSVKIR